MSRSRDEAGKMRHVDHQRGADPVGNRAEPGEIDDPRIGAAAGDDQFRPVRLGLALNLVVIDAPVIGAHPIGQRAKPFAGEVRRGAVRQMAAGGERHA